MGAHALNASQADSQTRLLRSMVGAEKAFRIPAQVEVEGKIVDIDKPRVQADQGCQPIEPEVEISR